MTAIRRKTISRPTPRKNMDVSHCLPAMLQLVKKGLNKLVNRDVSSLPGVLSPVFAREMSLFAAKSRLAPSYTLLDMVGNSRELQPSRAFQRFFGRLKPPAPPVDGYLRQYDFAAETGRAP